MLTLEFTLLMQIKSNPELERFQWRTQGEGA